MSGPYGSVQRVLVVGSPGSGKTTLARKLGNETGIPLYHLDDEHWGSDWTRPTSESWRNTQRELASRPQWIIDGNYLNDVPLRAIHADLAIVLDMRTEVCLSRIIKRTWQIKRGQTGHLPRGVAGDQANSWRATEDIVGLLRKAVTFRTNSLPILLAHLNNSQVPKIIILTQSRIGSRRCRRHKTHARECSYSLLVIEATTGLRMLSRISSVSTLDRWFK